MLSHLSRRGVILQRILPGVGSTATTATTAPASRTLTRVSSLSRKSSRQIQQLQWNDGVSTIGVRHLSTNPKSDDKSTNQSSDRQQQPQQQDEKESLKDTVRRMSGGAAGESDTKLDPRINDLVRNAVSLWSTLSTEVGNAWDELQRASERQDINKKLKRPEDTVDGDTEYTGPVSIMIINEEENLSAWQRMQKRLTEAPIIQDILSRSEEVYEKSGAKKVKEKVDHMTEDAREAWETSQNPWVYRMSSVYETLTADSPEAIAVAELRKLDPDFTLDDWRQDVTEHTLPKIMEWLLMGKINQLKPWLGESVFSRIAAEISARKQEGVQIDTHVLGIMNSEILAVEPDIVNKGSPIIVLHFMCQQINCVRKKEDGTVVEGSDDDIRANSYVAAFQREYDAEAMELNWKIIDFRFNGAIAYL